MTMEVRVAASLQGLVGDASIIQAQGETVRQLLDDIDNRFPGFKRRLISEQGKLNGSIFILLNDEDIRPLGELETPLKDGDVVSVLVVMSGG